MKHVKWTFVGLLLCSLTSFVDKGVATSGLSVGNVAPDFLLKGQDDGDALALKALQGKYVLLSFWASYDAQSRMQNARLGHARKGLGENLRMVSVSFDAYSSVFQEAVRMDGMDASDCYVEPAGRASALYKRYRLGKGFKNFLLDDKGVIVATNVTAEQLSRYIH